MENNYSISYAGSSNCPKCGKLYIYLGDIPEGGFPEGQEPWCTCEGEGNWKISFPKLNQGWICPVCGRGVNPNLNSCPCHCEGHGMSA